MYVNCNFSTVLRQHTCTGGICIKYILFSSSIFSPSFSLLTTLSSVLSHLRLLLVSYQLPFPRLVMRSISLCMGVLRRATCMYRRCQRTVQQTGRRFPGDDSCTPQPSMAISVVVWANCCRGGKTGVRCLQGRCSSKLALRL